MIFVAAVFFTLLYFNAECRPVNTRFRRCINVTAPLCVPDFTVRPDRLIRNVLITQCTMLNTRLITWGLVANK